MSKDVKVIYIVGEGRSGSTLLERMLGQHPQIFASGELIHIWERGIIKNQLCGCKKAFKECSIWKEIMNCFYRKRPGLKPGLLIEALSRTCRIRHYLLGRSLENFYSKLINDVYADLYKSIIESTEKEIVVDSSKHPVFAHILAQNKNIVLYVIHLVRDVRGVVYSWTKKKERPEVTSRKEYMPRYSVIRSSISWSIVNMIAFDLKSYPNVKYLKVSYEELTSSPRETLGKIYKEFGISFDLDNLFLDEKTIVLNTNHTVSGNPFRFKTGQIKIFFDDEWRRRLPFYKRLLVEFISYPIRRRMNSSL